MSIGPARNKEFGLELKYLSLEATALNDRGTRSRKLPEEVGGGVELKAAD